MYGSVTVAKLVLGDYFHDHLLGIFQWKSTPYIRPSTGNHGGIVRRGDFEQLADLACMITKV